MRRVPASVVLMTVLALSALVLDGCMSRQGHREPGQAFLDSRIPSDLAPQYYPPDGFVWAAYRSGHLPEARYGVASPPLNPHAQILILADADYPAEVWFEAAKPWLAAGDAVWLLEPPGQGGAGHYFLQGSAIHTPDYHHALSTASGLIRDLIRPTPERPLYVIGSQYSAIDALFLAKRLSGPSYAGFTVFDPYLGSEIAPGSLWHRDNPQPGYWGGIAQSWEMQNPDLRLRLKSAAWRKQTMQAFKDITGTDLPNGGTAPVTIYEPIAANAQQKQAVADLCHHIPHCTLRDSQGQQAFASEWLSDMHAAR